MDESAELIEVYRSNKNDAELVRSMLEGNGIPATIERGGIGMYPMTVGTLGDGRVFVREEDEDEARGLIGEATHGDFELDAASGSGRRTRPIYWVVAAILAGSLLALALLDLWNILQSKGVL